MFAGDDLACLRGPRLLFAGLSFALEPGGALLLTGPNGSGKSSLLRLMAGLLAPFAGRLTWNGEPVADAVDEHRARLDYLGYQDAVKPALSVAENLAFWAALADPHEAPTRARIALDEIGLAGLADLPGRYLSSGQRRRLAIARILVGGAPIWLLDEPTTALDTDGVERLGRALARHRDGGGMVVAATHGDLPLPGSHTLRIADHAPPADVLLADALPAGVPPGAEGRA